VYGSKPLDDTVQAGLLVRPSVGRFGREQALFAGAADNPTERKRLLAGLDHQLMVQPLA
jgi:hypothetical protein